MKPTASGTIQLTYSDETHVYRVFCRCGDLLYVGLTNNLFKRFVQHHDARSPWLMKADRIEWELYSTREAAERAESRLIRTLHPIYNVQGRYGRTPRWVDLPELLPPPSLDDRARAAHRVLALGDRL